MTASSATGRRQSVPTLAQLLHLVDRAASGRLLPAEALLLRQGLERGEQSARSLGGTQAALQAARSALKAAESELAVHRAARGAIGPLDVDCPRCGVGPQRRCVGGEYRQPTRQPHAARVLAAGGAAGPSR